jgi:hypothetical protein
LTYGENQLRDQERILTKSDKVYAGEGGLREYKHTTLPNSVDGMRNHSSGTSDDYLLTGKNGMTGEVVMSLFHDECRTGETYTCSQFVQPMF